MKNILIAGLGNPGKGYEKTRHNAGFLFVDFFREKYCENFGFSDWELKKKLDAQISVGKADGKKIILFKPQTFMNLSGDAVSAAVKYYKIPCRGETSTDFVVAHDEIDLPLGNFRVSKNASSAGHQGVQNIIDQLGTKDFTRLRIGVDNRGEKKIATEKYVLGKFTSAELKKMKTVILESSEDIQKMLLNF